MNGRVKRAGLLVLALSAVVVAPAGAAHRRAHHARSHHSRRHAHRAAGHRHRTTHTRHPARQGVEQHDNWVW
jgi:hypothetical protein